MSRLKKNNRDIDWSKISDRNGNYLLWVCSSGSIFSASYCLLAYAIWRMHNHSEFRQESFWLVYPFWQNKTVLRNWMILNICFHTCLFAGLNWFFLNRKNNEVFTAEKGSFLVLRSFLRAWLKNTVICKWAFYPPKEMK